MQAHLQHPGVVCIVDFGQTDRVHAIVQELVEGCALEHVLAERVPGEWNLYAAMRLLDPLCWRWPASMPSAQPPTRTRHP